MSLTKHILLQRFSWRALILVIAIVAALLGLIGPFFQKTFIDSLNETPLQVSTGFKNLLLFFVCFVSSIGCQLFAQFLGQREALQIQKELSQKIYTQMLNLKADRLKNTQVGSIVSLYAVDAAGSGALIELAWTMGALTLLPIILAPFLMQQLLNIPLGPLLLTMGISLSLIFALSWRQSRFFIEFKRLAAERSGLVNEWVQNIRALRILGWTTAYESKIFRKRREETLNRINMVSNGQTMATLGASLGFILNLVGVYTLVEARPQGGFSAGELTATLWALGVFVARYMRGIPWILTFTMDSYTSIKRVEAFLNLKSDDILIHDKNKVPSSTTLLEIEDLNLKIDDKALLKNISLRIDKPQLIALVGSVGSGKTLFLQSLLGEVAASFKSYTLHGKNASQFSEAQLKEFFSLVPQDGFTASTSIRNNILLEYDSQTQNDEDLNQRTLENLNMAHFTLEQEGFGEGQETLLGERGINLSGGQRQRLGLARALYANRPFLILDDSLSAVDVNTEKAMIDSLFRNRWKDRVVIFATHRLLTLPLTDRVLFFKNSRLIADGKFEDLVNSSPEFREFIQEAKKTEEPANDNLS